MKLKRRLSLVLIAAALAFANNTLAGSRSPIGESSTPAEPSDTSGAAAPPSRWCPLSGFGMTLAGGGGVTDFTKSSTRDVTDAGGAWTVRFGFETRRRLGFEFSYIGGANAIHGLGPDAGSRLVRNGIEGALRFQAPLYAKDTLLEPYAVAGVGWNGYHITNAETATASVTPTATNTFALPLAAGFAVGYKGFLADVRATIRPTLGQTALSNEGSAALTNYDLGGMLGFEF